MSKFHISNGNSKMGQIASFSLPAGVTCNPKAPCYKKCYARRMEYRFANVRNSYVDNLQMWRETPDILETCLQETLMMNRYFRFHVSGDIPDAAYFEMMVRLAEKASGCDILAFTKQYHIVNDYLGSGRKLPDNLHILFSVWKDFECPNPHHLPEAHVIYKDGSTTASGDFKICSGNCSECICRGIGCWMLKNGEQIALHEH